jgi:hypothetical protein
MFSQNLAGASAKMLLYDVKIPTCGNTIFYIKKTLIYSSTSGTTLEAKNENAAVPKRG